LCQPHCYLQLALLFSIINIVSSRLNQDWGDGGMTEVVQRQFQINRRDEFVKAFIQQPIARVVKPLQDKVEALEENEELETKD
jgi:uncharacterized protein